MTRHTSLHSQLLLQWKSLKIINIINVCITMIHAKVYDIRNLLELNISFALHSGRWIVITIKNS